MPWRQKKLYLKCDFIGICLAVFIQVPDIFLLYFYFFLPTSLTSGFSIFVIKALIKRVLHTNCLGV